MEEKGGVATRPAPEVDHSSENPTTAASPLEDNMGSEKESKKEEDASSGGTKELGGVDAASPVALPRTLDTTRPDASPSASPPSSPSKPMSPSVSAAASAKSPSSRYWDLLRKDVLGKNKEIAISKKKWRSHASEHKSLARPSHCIRNAGIGKTVVLFAVVAIAILAIPALLDSGAPRPTWPADFDSAKNLKVAVCLLILLTILIVFAALFDVMFHYLEMLFSSVFRPVLEALYKELMSLGLMGLLEFIIIKFELLTGLSAYLFCTDKLTYKTPTYSQKVRGVDLFGPKVKAAAQHSYNTSANATGNATGNASLAAPGAAFAGDTTGPSASCKSYEPYHCEVVLLHLLEDLHMILFLTIILYFAYSLWLLKSIQRRSEVWHELEVVARQVTGQNRLFSRYLKRKEQYESSRAKTCQRCRCMMQWRSYRRYTEASDDFQYALLRQRFMERGYTGNDPLDPDFNFAELYTLSNHAHTHAYCCMCSGAQWRTFFHVARISAGMCDIPGIDLSLCAAEMGEHILEISLSSWFRLWLYALILFAVQHAPPYLWIRCWVAFTLVLIAGALGFRRHVRWARDWVIPPLRYSDGQGKQVTSTWGHSIGSIGAEKPKFADVVEVMMMAVKRKRAERAAKAAAALGPVGPTSDEVEGDAEIDQAPNHRGKGREDKRMGGGAAELVHSNEYSRIHHLQHLNRGLSFRVGMVNYWLSEQGQHYLIMTFQTLVLYSVATGTLLFFQAQSIFPGISVGPMQTHEVLLTLLGALVPLLFSLYALPPGTFRDLVILCSVEGLKKPRHMTKALRHAKMKHKLQSLRLLVASRSEIRFRVALLRRGEQKGAKALSGRRRALPRSGRDIVDEITGRREMQDTRADETAFKSRLRCCGANMMRQGVVPLATLGTSHQRIATIIQKQQSITPAAKNADTVNSPEEWDKELQYASDERFVMDLKMVFDSFDIDKSGTVDRRELRAMLKELGVSLDIDEFHMLLREFGCVKPEDEIDFVTFARTMMKGDETCENEEELLHRVFRLFDLDDSGGITVEEFEVMVQRLNAGLTRQDIKMLISWIKENYEGHQADDDDLVISEAELKCIINIRQLMARSSIAKRSAWKAKTKRDRLQRMRYSVSS